MPSEIAPRAPQLIQRRSFAAQLFAAWTAAWWVGCTGRSPGRAKLPDPFAIEDQPPLALHIPVPSAAFAELVPWATTPPLEKLLHATLLRETNCEASWLARMLEPLDRHAPWSYLRLEGGQRCWAIAMRRNAGPQIRAQLARLPRDSVVWKLPHSTSSPSPWRVWFDETGSYLVLATGLRAVATGVRLRSHFAREGSRNWHLSARVQPLMAMLGLRIDDSGPVPVPQRVELRGSIARSEFSAIYADHEAPPPWSNWPSSRGDIPGLLADPQTRWGVGFRYADARTLTAEVQRELQAQMRGLNFILRGIANEHLRGLDQAMATWDGRVVAAHAHTGRLRLALGSSNLASCERALVTVLRQASSQVATARKFSSSLPKVVYKRSKAPAGIVHRLAIAGASRYVPREFRALLDAKKRIRAALHFDQARNSVLITLGAEAPDEMDAWLAQRGTSKSTPSMAHAVLALPPQQVLDFARRSSPPNLADLSKLLRVNSAPQRYEAIVEGGGHQWRVTTLRSKV